MRVSIFGLGYVGTVCAACLARFGHDVVGVDLNEDKNAQISAGRSPIVEPGLEELIREAVDAGRLEATGRPRARDRHHRALADLRRNAEPAQRQPGHEPRRGGGARRSAAR